MMMKIRYWIHRGLYRLAVAVWNKPTELQIAESVVARLGEIEARCIFRGILPNGGDWHSRQSVTDIRQRVAVPILRDHRVLVGDYADAPPLHQLFDRPLYVLDSVRAIYRKAE